MAMRENEEEIKDMKVWAANVRQDENYEVWKLRWGEMRNDEQRLVKENED